MQSDSNSRTPYHLLQIPPLLTTMVRSEIALPPCASSLILLPQSANYSEFTSQTKQRDGQAATANRVSDLQLDEESLSNC